MNTVSFTGYRPGPRFPPVLDPWTYARIEEATSAAGPWTLIETIALVPLDANPAQPAERSFTTEQATLERGWYRVVFLDASGDRQPTEPVLNAGLASGSRVRTFADVRPPVTAGIRFVRARLLECGLNGQGQPGTPVIAGEWELRPVDTDPGTPRRRVLTTTSAALEDCWYQLIWIDDEGNEAADAPVRFKPEATPADVAALLPARTVVRGVELGRFTNPGDAAGVTRPTLAEVMVHLQIAASDLAASLPRPVPDNHRWRRNAAVALRAAVLAEARFYPRDAEAGDGISPAREYRAMYRDTVAALVKLLRRHLV